MITCLKSLITGKRRMTALLVMGLLNQACGSAGNDYPGSGGSAGSNNCVNCVSGQIPYTEFLVEMRPRSSDRDYGGLNYFSTVMASELSTGLLVENPANLSLSVIAPDSAQSCSFLQGRSVPFTVNFTPIQSRLGLSLSQTVSTSALVNQAWTADENALSTRHGVTVRTAPGYYDIEIVPAISELLEEELVSGSPCYLPPQIFRNVEVLSGEAAVEFKIAEPKQLSVNGLGAAFEGWQLDVVHPVTGERLSPAITLSGAEAIQLPLGEVTGPDFMAVGSEVIRLSGPKGSVLPRFWFHRSGVEIFKPLVADLPVVPSVWKPVDYKTKIVDASDDALGLADVKIVFNAIQLSAVPAGVEGTYSTSTTSDENGEISVPLFPGTYSVELIPQQGDGYSNKGIEIEIGDGLDAAVGAATIALSKALKIEFSYLLPSEIGLQLTLSPSQRYRLPCALDASKTSLEDSVPCFRQSNAVLAALQGRNPVAPRARSTTQLGDEVTRDAAPIESLDCPECELGKDAWYDLSILSNVSGTSPIYYLRDIRLNQSGLSSGGNSLSPQLSKAISRTVSIGFRGEQTKVSPFSGVGVRLYVPINREGDVLSSTKGLRLCINEPTLSKEAYIEAGINCLAGYRLVAESSSDDNGIASLVFPSTPELQ